MLEQPWPPPAPGPQQPRDAHGAQWANDAARRARGPARAASSDPDAEAWGDLPGRERVARRRVTDERRERGGRGHDDQDADGREHDHRPRPLPARWVPQEEWIPDPWPAPEQRWTPEQDWLSVFAAREEAVAAAPVDAPRGARRWWLLAGALLTGLGAVVALVVVLA
ncbi:hypothetical protein [Cellulomonas phragmiteti]|uniref:Uncharacterized protein n=1 Tax=Cellulomonas phragmiteti TaxID=478780 RepID=A0ABQ4DQE3_9CELL|nr:hypothetical protein [Cellulomonas phragmiteti]GIG41576.1 hypothetical protein Cph01nite_33380 [Cellulomonas phragmiteti]